MIKESAAHNGTLSDVARSYRLGRLLNVHLETISVEEEVIRQISKVGEIKEVQLRNAFDIIVRVRAII